MLTLSEYHEIDKSLKQVSDTWSDLWVCLHHLPIGISRLIALRYTAITEMELIIEIYPDGRREVITLPDKIQRIIHRRRRSYPEDIYIFQSHSNRVKAKKKPVTLIAFNSAIKRAALGVTRKVVSSGSARILS